MDNRSNKLYYCAQTLAQKLYEIAELFDLTLEEVALVGVGAGYISHKTAVIVMNMEGAPILHTNAELLAEIIPLIETRAEELRKEQGFVLPSYL